MKGLVGKSRLFFKRNGSTILTIIGAAGVVTTTVLAIKATPKAVLLLEEAKKEKGEELDILEKVKVAAPIYIPTVVSGLSTITCIFGANYLNKRQQASLVSAYALLDNSYKEYKNKVKELYGKEIDDDITEHIAQDKYKERDIKNDEVLFYDKLSGQFFTSTLVKVKEAEYYLNREIHMAGWAELNDFYEYLDMDNYEGGEALGWSEGGNLARYWQAWIDFTHSKAILEDGTEYIIVEMFQEPYLEWDGC